MLVARAGNVIGGGDFAENRLIPDIIRSVISGKDLKIRSPLATRPWQHAIDPIVGYLQYIEFASKGSDSIPSLNFGPLEPSLSVKRVLELARHHFQDKFQVSYQVNGRQLESHSLELDSTRAFEKIAWRPQWSQEYALTRTFLWWEKVLLDPTQSLEACFSDIDLTLKTSKNCQLPTNLY